MVYCGELSFGVLSYYSYIDIEKMKIFFSDVEENEYKLSGTKSKNMVEALKILKMPLFIKLLKI